MTLPQSPCRASTRSRSTTFLVAGALFFALGGGACTPSPGWTKPISGLAPILLSVWGTSPSDVWVVGGTCDFASGCQASAQSIVMHFDGSNWTTLDAGASAVLWWVYGFADNDLFIVGSGGTILHYDGTTFTKMTSPAAATDTLFGVWGSSPTDVWVVGGNPDSSSTALHYDGSAWTVLSTITAPHGTWYKVWGSSTSDVWMVGQVGALGHYDGTNFSTVDLSPLGVKNQGLFTASGRSASDVYVVGGDQTGLGGIALHYDGGIWSNVVGVTSASLLTGVFETSVGDVAMTGLGGTRFVGSASSFRDDSADTSLGVPDDLHAVWMADPNNIFAVGGDYDSLTSGIVAHYGQSISSTRN